MIKPNQEQLIETLSFHNPWWQSGEVPEALLQDYHRPIFDLLRQYLSLERIIVLKGPRRTGKTTLLYQIINWLVTKKHVNPQKILYVSFDDVKARVDLDLTIEAYQRILKKNLKESGQVYFFLDEVHFLENWQFCVKKYFDKKYKIKFIVSGSAASLIKKSTESLAGRTIEEILLPFSFSEFVSFRTKNQRLLQELFDLKSNFNLEELENLPDISALLPYRQEVEILFDEFQNRGGFPHIFEVKNEVLWKKLLKEDIIEKVIYRDLVELYSIKKPLVLEKLFLYLASISSQILNISNIANSLRLSREYTEKYLYYLEQALLCFTLKKYAKTIESQIRTQEKVFLVDAGLINAFGRSGLGERTESMIASCLWSGYRDKLYYWRNRREIDFILKLDKEIIPIEVKYKDNIDKKDFGGFEELAKKTSFKKGFLVTKSVKGKRDIAEKQIFLLPAWLFLLLQ